MRKLVEAGRKLGGSLGGNWEETEGKLKKTGRRLRGIWVEETGTKLEETGGNWGKWKKVRGNSEGAWRKPKGNLEEPRRKL